MRLVLTPQASFFIANEMITPNKTAASGAPSGAFRIMFAKISNGIPGLRALFKGIPNSSQQPL